MCLSLFWYVPIENLSNGSLSFFMMKRYTQCNVFCWFYNSRKQCFVLKCQKNRTTQTLGTCPTDSFRSSTHTLILFICPICFVGYKKTPWSRFVKGRAAVFHSLIMAAMCVYSFVPLHIKAKALYEFDSCNEATAFHFSLIFISTFRP